LSKDPYIFVDIIDAFVEGDIRIEISNRRGEYISKLPGSQQKKLYVELKLTWHGV